MKREAKRRRQHDRYRKLTVTETKRTTYPQNWSAYNDAQTHEQDKFQVLLADLCSGLSLTQPKTGRPRLPLSDAVFNIVFKVYSHRFPASLYERFAGST